MNLKIRQLEDSLIDTINASDINIETKRLVVSNILSLIEKQADKTIIAEIKQSQVITEEGGMKDAESTRCEQE